MFSPLFSLTASTHVNFASVVTYYGHFELVIVGGQVCTHKNLGILGGKKKKNLKESIKNALPSTWMRALGWRFLQLKQNKYTHDEWATGSLQKKKWDFWEKLFCGDV